MDTATPPPAEAAAEPAQHAAKPAPGSIIAPLAAGLMIAAGVMHLMLVEDHLGLARGSGLFFAFLGAAQVAWGAVFLREHDRRVAIFGFAVLAVAPLVLWTITRIWDAPWHGSPEQVDVLGVATQTIQTAAGLLLVGFLAPLVPGRKVAFAAAVGVALAFGSYGAAVQVEPVEWLATAEAPHLHGEDHDSHLTFEVGERGKVIVGDTPYFGPLTAADAQASCSSNTEEIACLTTTLKDILMSKGSVFTFDVLVDLIADNPEVDRASHSIAHELGRFAYQVYAYDITKTLANCSYEVFQGCLHGSLQIYFDDISEQGRKVTGSVVKNTCPSGTPFEEYACLHGLGHGVTLYTNYDRDESLKLCDGLVTYFATNSCYGGVFMENVVGYQDSLNPTAAGGHQGHGGHDDPPVFWIDPERPAYPCTDLAERYKSQCWQMQTSIILMFNNGNFQQASQVCDEQAAWRLTCYQSLGRDAGPYTARNPSQMVQHCSYGAADAQTACVRGFTAETILNYNSGDNGLALCAQLPSNHKSACYEETGQQTGNMLTKAQVADFCAKAPSPYDTDCRRGAGLQ